MKTLIDKFAGKMVKAGLAEEGAPLIAGMDDIIYWNRSDPIQEKLSPLFDVLNINSLIFCEPAEPYRSILAYLAEKEPGDALKPNDTETRIFLHELPLAADFSLQNMVSALSKRKLVIVAGRSIVTTGTVTPEQAFVAFSSVCFAASVKLVLDILTLHRNGKRDKKGERIIALMLEMLDIGGKATSFSLEKGLLKDERRVLEAMFEAGRATVQSGLVDSYFGNISYRLGDTLYISQSGSSLDELEGRIDPCPLDGSSSAGITASSELPAHMKIAGRGPGTAVLHGHPKFSVALSMDCGDMDCGFRGRCHTHCPKKREVAGFPVVPGEVGAGPKGLHKTLPPALEKSPAAIVFGHGVFSVGHGDFVEAFEALSLVESEAMHIVSKQIFG
ncbi:MAG: rRNA adenine dimethylase [Deltaproteobacteria bacterium]|nr:rRNA adenine dimethylase [Deltaproteobacteria bacterium]